MKYLIKLKFGGQAVIEATSYREMAKLFLQHYADEKIEKVEVWSNEIVQYVPCDKIGL